MFKTRSEAQVACSGGRVKLNGSAVKASHIIKRGDELSAECPRGSIVYIVRELAEKRLSAALASELYEDRSPPPPPKEERFFAIRGRGAGRPTKADRRATERLRGE